MQWFISYLENQKHWIKIKNVKSKDLILRGNVPQDSVLGPLLFLVFMNELLTSPQEAEIIGYADYISLLYSAATVEEIEDQLNCDTNLLQPWFKRNYLHLNANKCKAMIYTSSYNINNTGPRTHIILVFVGSQIIFIQCVHYLHSAVMVARHS